MLKTCVSSGSAANVIVEALTGKCSTNMYEPGVFVCVCSCYLFWNHLWFLFGLRIEYKHFTSELVAGHVIKKGSYVISRKTKMTLETLEFGSKPFQIVLGSGFIERPLSTLSLSLSSSSTTVSEAPSIIAFAL